MLDSLTALLCRRNYKKVLKRIKKSKGSKPVKVLFLVTENSKWGYQSLYETFDKDEDFEPLVVVSVLKDVHKGKDKTRMNLEENYNFFKSRGMKVEYGYKNHKYIDLRKFNPDIVFYEQPWGIPHIHKPKKVSAYALCAHISYGIASNPKVLQGGKVFFTSLWKFFIAHECLLKEYYETLPDLKGIIEVTGHPKLDVYENYLEKEHEKFTIIYAPHFSVGKSLLHFSTFDWSGYFILEWAKNHPEINWIFKPHPNLKSHFIKTGYMKPHEVEAYFEEWQKIGKVYTQGDYFNLFKNSDGMITDCGSFLIEYFATGKPILHLVSCLSARHNELIKLVGNNYYKIYNLPSLKCYLEEIFVKRNDFMKNIRQEECLKILSKNFNSAEKIFNYIKGVLL